MTIEEQVARLGGLRPIRGTRFEVPEAELVEIERMVGASLPDSYRRFLRTYGASTFNQNVEFEPRERLPSSISSDGRGSFGAFYGALAHAPQDLLSNLACYRDRMPEQFLPIADDSGNELAMQLGGDRPGAIYYWDHNNEWDEEDYLEDNEPVPPDLKWQNVTLIATSFEDFLARLAVYPEA